MYYFWEEILKHFVDPVHKTENLTASLLNKLFPVYLHSHSLPQSSSPQYTADIFPLNPTSHPL